MNLELNKITQILINEIHNLQFKSEKLVREAKI